MSPLKFVNVKTIINKTVNAHVFLACILCAFFLCGCIGPVGYTHSLGKLQIGMTKAEVIRVMGEPNSVSATENVEYLNYHLAPAGGLSDVALMHTYFVRIINGKVDAYGRRGDFDSTKDPTINVRPIR